MKLSRREMMGTALLAAATTQVQSQAQEGQKGEDWLTVSVEQNKRNAEALAKVTLPQPVEPAFVFKP